MRSRRAVFLPPSELHWTTRQRLALVASKPVVFPTEIQICGKLLRQLYVVLGKGREVIRDLLMLIGAVRGQTVGNVEKNATEGVVPVTAAPLELVKKYSLLKKWNSPLPTAGGSRCIACAPPRSPRERRACRGSTFKLCWLGQQGAKTFLNTAS